MAAQPNDIAKLLRDTAEAHHQAFLAVDGADPEWPLWYADQLVKPLSSLIGFDFTKSEVVYLLVLLSKAQSSKPAGSDWPTDYAAYILEHYPSTK